MKKVFVTGAAGFIGSNLVDRLLKDGITVVGWDNFSTGRREFLTNAQRDPKFLLEEGDCLDLDALKLAMVDCDGVFHLAANADVRFGIRHPRKDLEQNTIATFHVLEAMRAQGIRTIAFASTGSIYGETTTIPTPEDASFPIQTSLYGASKLAGEGLIQAYVEGFGMEAYIFRFVSILGERYTHGHVFDFYKQIREHPDYLRILGNGSQRKSYLYIQDCLEAMLHVIRVPVPAAARRIGIYNLGTNEFCQVRDSVRWICEELKLNPKLEFTGGDRGWIGDNPFIFLDTSRIRKTGWNATLNIRESVVRTLRWLKENPSVLERSAA